jgi:histidine triad (HIT) family protein
MSSPAYDPNNIFAKILRGEIPCHKVYEDDRTLAFMDIMPRVDGHTLVIPKAPSRTLLDIEAGELQHLIVIVQKIARAAKEAFQADGVTMAQYSESAGGQVVFHTHFHVLPRQTGVDLRPSGIMGDQALIAEHAKRLAEVVGQH